MEIYIRNCAELSGPQPDHVVAKSETQMSTATKVQIFGESYNDRGGLGRKRTCESWRRSWMKRCRRSQAIQARIHTQKAAVLAAVSRLPMNCTVQGESGAAREELLKEQAERCLTLVERAIQKTDKGYPVNRHIIEQQKRTARSCYGSCAGDRR